MTLWRSVIVCLSWHCLSFLIGKKCHYWSIFLIMNPIGCDWVNEMITNFFATIQHYITLIPIVHYDVVRTYASMWPIK